MKAAYITLSRRYARAYMALDGPAFDARTAAAARARLEELEKARNSAARFNWFLAHPLIGCEDKLEILAKLLPRELLTSQAAGLARLLIRENRICLLDAAVEECAGLYHDYAGVIRAGVTSRYGLAPEETARIEKMIYAAFGKKALVAPALSERVIGGVEIRIGDLLIDATVKGRLERLKGELMAE